MKKIMMLGGNYFQMTATKKAKEMGLYVIDVDYLPENPAHKYADEYHNVSTLDKESVLELAERLNIDGIISYASDISAPTAAFVSEKMGLATNPYESVMIMTHKNLMRPFMEKKGFNVPKGKGFTNFSDARDYATTLDFPIMIKPVDASGSKGVTKILDINEFEKAYDEALNYSISKTVIVEEYVQRSGYQIAGDAFLVDGKIQFAGLMNEHFDRLCNPLVPIGESYPSLLNDELRKKSIAEIQRLLSALGMKNGAINLDFMVNEKGDVYIIELGPRNGGNLITDAIYESSGVDLAKYTILAALGEDCSSLSEKQISQYTSSYIIHAIKDGNYNDLWISNEIKEDIIRSDVFVKPGEPIKAFRNGAFGIGAMLIKHGSIDEMTYRMDHMEEFIRVV